MTPICVLRSGGDFAPIHVQWLARQVPGLVCLTDMDVPGVKTLPLYYGWPGWWSKLEVFRPDITGELLYLDLDTVVLGDLSEFNVGVTTVLRDFTQPGQIGSGFMYLVEMDRPRVWAAFVQDPARHMAECQTQARWGDQGFLQGVLIAQKWQDVLPGRVVSYKMHCQHDVPRGAKIVCFHGQPRPWAVREPWVPTIKAMDAQPPSEYNNGTPVNKDTAVSNLPKYFKDAAGYCYVATETLAKKAGMTPWDGAVDANGYATQVPAVAPTPEPKRTAQRATRAAVKRTAPADDAPDAANPLNFDFPDFSDSPSLEP